MLGVLNREPGADHVAEVIAGAYLSAVNLAEVARKLVERGDADGNVERALASLTCQVVALDEQDAIRAGLLRRATKFAGLSLADCICLVLAQRLGLPAVTADRTWAPLDLGVEVVLIR